MSDLNNIPTFDDSTRLPLSDFRDVDRRFKLAIQRSMAGQQTPEDDSVVSSYCSRAPWRVQPYCACVNAPKIIFANPQCSFGPCQSSTYAYVPTKLQGFASGEKTCPPTAICIQGMSTEGRKNIAQNVKQDQTCSVGQDPNNPSGPVVHNETKKNTTPPKSDGILQQLTDNPLYIGIFLVVLVVIGLLIAVIAGSGGSANASSSPAAASGLPPLPPLPATS